MDVSLFLSDLPIVFKFLFALLIIVHLVTLSSRLISYHVRVASTKMNWFYLFNFFCEKGDTIRPFVYSTFFFLF